MECYIGIILPFGGTRCPQGFMTTAGQALQISQYQALTAVIGWTFGGDGETTIGVPNLNGCLAIGTGSTTGGQNLSMGEYAGSTWVELTGSNLTHHTHAADFTPTTAPVTFSIPGSAGAGSLSASIPVVAGADPQGIMEPAASGVFYALTGLSQTDGSGAPLEGTGPFTANSTGLSQNARLPGVVRGSADYAPPTPAATVLIQQAFPVAGQVNVAPTGSTTLPGSMLNVMQPSLAINFILCVQGIFPNRAN